MGGGAVGKISALGLEGPVLETRFHRRSISRMGLVHVKLRREGFLIFIIMSLFFMLFSRILLMIGA